MITKIELVNFQGHKNLTLDFSNGINAIVGDSDKGKSTILRAIEWCTGIYKPPYDEIRHVDPNTGIASKSTTVILYINDHKIERFASSTKNMFVVDDCNNFTAFGSNIPDSITNICRMTALNTQRQLEPLFLIDESSGAISSAIGELVEVSVMDACIKHCWTTVKSNESELARVSTDIECSELELKIINSKLELINPLLKIYENVSTEYTTVNNTCNCLNKIISSCDPIIKYRGISIETPSVLYSNIEEYTVIINAINNIINAYNKFAPVLLNNTDNYINEAFNIIERLNDVFVKLQLVSNLIKTYSISQKDLSLFCDATPLDVAKQSYDMCVNRVVSLELLLKTHIEKVSEINSIQCLIDDTSKDLSEFDSCPLCGGILHE